MGQAMGSNGAHSAVPCETSLTQASLWGPALAGEMWDRASFLPPITLTASLPCTHHTRTHPAFIQSPGHHATGGLGARSDQVEPRVWAMECEVGPQS